MLDFVIFAVTLVVFLIATVIYLYPGSNKKSTTVPGLDPSDTRDGNLMDIAKAGSLHEFLVYLHDEFGDIASFWMGSELVISIASPEMFEEHSKVFDRPAHLFTLMEPLISPQSILYANKAEGKMRQQLYKHNFSHSKLPQYFTTLQKVADGLCKNLLAHASDEHIPLMKYMFASSFKATLLTMFGSYFDNNKIVLELRESYDVCWYELENRLDGDLPLDDDPRNKAFIKHKEKLYAIMKEAFDNRKNNKPKEGEELLIDTLLNSSLPESIQLADAVTYLNSSFQKTGLMLTWAVYFLATHDDVQKKLKQEIKDTLGDEDVSPSNFSDLKYINQVLDETLRCSMLETFAARVQDFETELDGHKIPAETPVIHALGVTFQDEDIWPEPNRFDPERFSDESKESREEFSFSPFGFSGQRQCPGSKFAYAEAIIVLVTMLRKMTFQLVEGQVVMPTYSIMTKPNDEIWITLKSKV